MCVVWNEVKVAFSVPTLQRMSVKRFPLSRDEVKKKQVEVMKLLGRKMLTFLPTLRSNVFCYLMFPLTPGNDF